MTRKKESKKKEWITPKVETLKFNQTRGMISGVSETADGRSTGITSGLN